jgi:peptidase E
VKTEMKIFFVPNYSFNDEVADFINLTISNLQDDGYSILHFQVMRRNDHGRDLYLLVTKEVK